MQRGHIPVVERTRKFKAVDESPIGNPAESRDGFQNILAKHILVLIRESILPNMEPNSLQNDHATSILAICVVEVMVVHEFTLDCKQGFADPARFDFARRERRETTERPF